MSGVLLVILGVLERGLIFSLLALGVYIPARIMRYDDFSLEGGFSFGAAVGAIALSRGINPVAALGVGACAGMLLGLVVAFLHLGLKFSVLMSGVIVSAGVFSVSLMVAGANLSLIGLPSCFSWLAPCGHFKHFVVLSVVVFVLFSFLFYVLHHSYVGLVLRAAGFNELLLSSMGRSVGLYKVIALSLTNTLMGFTGALYVQYLGYFSIWMSSGMLMVAFSGLMLAELFPVRRWLLHLIIGSGLYQLLLTLVYSCDVDPQWSKFLTSLLIVVAGGINLIGLGFSDRKK